MKKLFFLSILFITLSEVEGLSQSFEKGNRILDFQVGFVVATGTIQHNGDTAKSQKTGAAGVTFAPQMNWAVGKRISIGTSLLYSHYLDSAKSNPKPRTNGLDANFIFDFHFVKSKKVDLYAGVKLGLAGIRYNPNDGSGNIYGSMGSVRDLHINGRFYISERTSIIASLGFAGSTYNKFGDNLNDTYTLKYRGVSIATGVAMKLKSKGEGSSGK